MTRYLKIARLAWAMATRTAYLASKTARMSEREALHFRAQRQRIGCRLLCRILGFQVRIEGDLPDHRGMLVVSNHFGVLDPIILASEIPAAFVGKAELRKWPFIGWVALTHGLLLVDRERRTTVSQFTEEVRRRLDAGVHVLVFPEGTTSPDENLLPFKTGAFEAVSGVEDAYILPVYLAVDAVNGRQAVGPVRKQVVWSDPNLPFLKHAWDVAGLRSIQMSIRVGRPIRTSGRDRKSLAQVAQDAVEALRVRPGALPETLALR